MNANTLCKQMLRVGLLLISLIATIPVTAMHRIPTLYITTADTSIIITKDTWCHKTAIRLVSARGDTLYDTRHADIRLRGNSTLQKPKKPYALRLPEAAGLLGMHKSRKWALLANFMDHSNVRNLLAYAVAGETSLDWSPHGAMVDVVVNGHAQGLYLLTETVTVGKSRIDIKGREGFLLECDVYTGRHDTLVTPLRHLPLQVHSPKHPTQQQMEDIRTTFSRIERLLYRGGKADMATLYRQYIDAKSFADWWIVQEMAQNAEPNGPRSCFMHRNGRGKVKAGPVWDFDLAFIDVGLDGGGDLRPARLRRHDAVLLTVDSLYCPRALWYDRLLQDPAFVAIVQKRWHKLRPRFERLTSLFAIWRSELSPSATDNERQWARQDPARFDERLSFDDSIGHLEDTFRRRLVTLDGLIHQLYYRVVTCQKP